MKTFTLIILWLAFASAVLADDRVREAQVDDIREAVFRWQFEHNASALQKDAKAYYLEVGEKRGEKGDDPSDAFMKRFAGHKPPVGKLSACMASASKGVLDKKTGEKGLIFRAKGLKWNSDTEVEVVGGYYEAGASSSVNTFTVKKENGKWKVTDDRLDEIS